MGMLGHTQASKRFTSACRATAQYEKASFATQKRRPYGTPAARNAPDFVFSDES